jgi:hypothetical protein
MAAHATLGQQSKEADQPPRPHRPALRRTWRLVRRIVTLVGSTTAIFVLALTGYVSPAVFAGQRALGTAAARIDLWPLLPRPLRLRRVVTAARRRGCRPTVGTAGYVNPLKHARVKGERIDQGVDYAGTGILAALGPGRVTEVSTGYTGWPGAFLEYRLLGGADAGCYVYYAEGVSPAHGLRVGQTLRAGQNVASIIPGWPTGIEIGWAAGRHALTFAEKARQWTARDDADNIPTAAGKVFSSLVGALGGPRGRDEG